MFIVAETIGCTLDSVMAMSQAEFKGWVAYLNRKAKKEKNANTRANNTRR